MKKKRKVNVIVETRMRKSRLRTTRKRRKRGMRRKGREQNRKREQQIRTRRGAGRGEERGRKGIRKKENESMGRMKGC